MFPRRAIADFKSYSSRALNRMEGQQQRWARGGNARTLKPDAAIHAATLYVAAGQGEPMAVYVCERGSSPTRKGGDSVVFGVTESPP